MTVHDLPNVTVRGIGNPVSVYKITANDGYCIHDTVGHAENEYALIVIVPATYNFSNLQVLAIADLPEGAEIHSGDVETEVASAADENVTE